MFFLLLFVDPLLLLLFVTGSCTCKPKIQTKYIAVEVPKMIPVPTPVPVPMPVPMPKPPPKKTHIISIQEVEVPSKGSGWWG